MLAAFLSLIESESDKHKFERIYEKYSDLVYNIAYRRLKDYHLAQDVIQDTFFYVAKSIQRYNDDIDSEDTAKLICIIANRCAIRKYNKQKNDGLKLTPDYSDVSAYSIDDYSDEYILESISQLDEECVLVVILKCKYDLKTSEIADMLNTSESTVKNRLHKAREILKQELKEYQTL